MSNYVIIDVLLDDLVEGWVKSQLRWELMQDNRYKHAWHAINAITTAGEEVPVAKTFYMHLQRVCTTILCGLFLLFKRHTTTWDCHMKQYIMQQRQWQKDTLTKKGLERGK
jgi:hypothetical protein